MGATTSPDDNINDNYKDMSYLRQFYEITIKPFIEHFFDLYTYFSSIIIASAMYWLFMVFTFFEELLYTPELWWKGLMFLVALDFLAGNYRALFDKDVEWNINRWARTGFKIPAYIMAVFSVGAIANMFPAAMSWVQYVTFIVLSGKEVVSILNNLKLIAVIDVLIDQAGDKGGFFESIKNIKKETDRRARKKFYEKQSQNYKEDANDG